MPIEVQITSNRLVALSPVLTGLLLVAPTRLATAPRATVEGFDEGGWSAKQAIFPPNKPNFKQQLTNYKSTT
jgi:hypothetical protein